MNGALPYRLRHESGAPLVEWIAGDGARFTEPFFEDSIARLVRTNPANAGSRRARTPLSALLEGKPGVPPDAFIFHTSRCGSTLVAQMLAALPRHLVASEPPILDDLLSLRRRVPPAGDEACGAWLRGALAALGQPAAGGTDRFFVKLDSWHLFALPLIARTFPGVPLLFVHRHPVEVLVSLMRKPSLLLVRGTVTADELGLSDQEIECLSREEHAAALLGALFRAARTHRSALVPVAYERLPAFVWEDWPGCAFTPEERALLQTASTRDTKFPTRAFTPDVAEKRRTATPAVLAAAARWAEPDYLRWLAVA